MWPNMFRFYDFYSSLRLPDIPASTGCPHQKRSRSHSGDYTRPKAKMSKHRKFIFNMDRVRRNGWITW